MVVSVSERAQEQGKKRKVSDEWEREKRRRRKKKKEKRRKIRWEGPSHWPDEPRETSNPFWRRQPSPDASIGVCW